MSDSPYSSFFTSGLHATSTYTYNYPEMDAPCSPTGDLAYFPAPSSPRTLSPRSPSRKRRSSLTTATSPISSMKLTRSPARSAANAWYVANVAVPHSPSRSRSGSFNVASEDTSMFGRMRSGSVGSRIRTKKPLSNRRLVALLSAPTQPPPTAPLPALPLCAPARPPLTRLAIQPALPAAADAPYTKPPASPVPSSPSTELYHPPGAWTGFGTIDEEEMKEN